MGRLLTVFVLTLFCATGQAQFQGLIVNEFSQGNSGNREYIEILVVGTRSCTDSTADIRGWILDDQNGWYGTSSSTPGHYRFKDDLNWAAVPFGSIILLYNANDKNTSITLADDPTDVNGDLAYIVPVGSTYIEQYAFVPSNTSGPNYTYPSAATTAGYLTSSNQWQFYIALNNTNGDVISLVSPANRSAAYFSIGYGYTIAGGFQNPAVSIGNVAGSNHAYLTGSNYSDPSQWTIEAVPSNETPGSPNGGANSTWILSMRLGRPKIIINSSASQVCFNTEAQITLLSYNWTYQSPTHYSITWNSTPANSFVAVTNAVLPAGPVTISVPAGTQPGIYTGNLTVSNATGTSCTSIPFTVSVDALPSIPVFTVTQPDCTTATGSISITSPTGAGMEYSIDGINYQTSNVFNNLAVGIYGVRVRNASGCLSLVNPININAPTGVVTTSATACINEGNTYNFNGQLLTTTGNYTTTYPRPGRCDSMVNLYLMVSRTVVDRYSGCGSFNYKGTVYTNSITLRDTLISTLTGCDSIYRVVNITINPEPVSAINICLPSGQTYLFNGQLLTASGQYVAVLNTVAGCDSTVNLTLVITSNETVQVSGCTSVTYNGVTYTSDTTLQETILSVTNCDSVVRTINIVVIAKLSITISGDKTICRGDSVLLTASSPNAVTNWIGIGPGNTIKVAPTATTTYFVTATNPSGCSDTMKVTVYVNDFDAQLFTNVNPVIAGKTVQLRTSANASYRVVTWQPFNTVGGFTKSFVADTSLTVMVTTLSVKGCIDIDSLPIVVDPLSDIYIPTAFTPNRDGKNDLFVIGGGEFKNFDLKIFNRWGQIVFYSKERSKGWDGSLENKEAIPGTYVYILSYTLKNGKKIQRNGTVLLIR